MLFLDKYAILLQQYLFTLASCKNDYVTKGNWLENSCAEFAA